ncbi:MAG: DMT family transporter [Actinomycetota bacterium]|nr:DMT family transporter [Actinomycetota bacterium]
MVEKRDISPRFNQSAGGARVAELGLVGIAAIWGLTFPLVQDAVVEIPATTFLAYRFLSAAALVALVFRAQVARLSLDGLRAGALMGVFLTAGYVFQTLGLERTSASHAGFITGLFVVLTPLFAAVLFRLEVGRAGWIAAACSALGLFMLSGTGGEGTSLLGDGLVFLCAVSFSFHILATDRGARGYEIGALLAVQLAVCGLITFVLAATQGDLVAPPSGSVWIALVVTSVLASGLGFFVQTYAQQHASAARTALILASEPAFAGLFAYLIKDEVLPLLGWFGAGLIMAAIVAVEVVPHLRRPVPLPEG